MGARIGEGAHGGAIILIAYLAPLGPLLAASIGFS
jgi:hypothetical protein